MELGYRSRHFYELAMEFLRRRQPGAEAAESALRHRQYLQMTEAPLMASCHYLAGHDGLGCAKFESPKCLGSEIKLEIKLFESVRCMLIIFVIILN